MNLEKWYSLRERTAALSLRERGIVAAVVVVLVLFIWAQFVFLPYEKKQKQNAVKIAGLGQDIVTSSERLSELTGLLANDPNTPLRAKQKSLQKQMITLTADIESRLSNLVAPEKMADLMRKVLADYKGLRLLSAKNLPVEPLQIKSMGTQTNIDNDAPSAQQTVLFAHGFEMVLSGRYFQALAFLQHLEEMKGFYWQALDYKVGNYPKAEITIKISTLSLEEDWIGV
ncbi:MAG: MSHA biogenesis protein MshJ [Oleiphilaceae bacterium]